MFPNVVSGLVGSLEEGVVNGSAIVAAAANYFLDLPPEEPCECGLVLAQQKFHLGRLFENDKSLPYVEGALRL